MVRTAVVVGGEPYQPAAQPPASLASADMMSHFSKAADHEIARVDRYTAVPKRVGVVTWLALSIGAPAKSSVLARIFNSSNIFAEPEDVLCPEPQYRYHRDGRDFRLDWLQTASEHATSAWDFLTGSGGLVARFSDMMAPGFRFCNVPSIWAAVSGADIFKSSSRSTAEMACLNPLPSEH